jgi:hypothetical protein
VKRVRTQFLWILIEGRLCCIVQVLLLSIGGVILDELINDEPGIEVRRPPIHRHCPVGSGLFCVLPYHVHYSIVILDVQTKFGEKGLDVLEFRCETTVRGEDVMGDDINSVPVDDAADMVLVRVRKDGAEFGKGRRARKQILIVNREKTFWCFVHIFWEEEADLANLGHRLVGGGLRGPEAVADIVDGCVGRRHCRMFEACWGGKIAINVHQQHETLRLTRGDQRASTTVNNRQAQCLAQRQ